MAIADDYSKNYMQVYLDGTKLDARMLPHVSSIRFTDDEKKLDMATIEFELPQGTGDDLASKLKLYGKELKLELLRDGTVTRTFLGDILDIDWSRSAGSPRSCTLSAWDKLHRLKKGRKTKKPADRRFRGQKVTDIVTTICKDWSWLSTDIESSDAMLAQDLTWKGSDGELLAYLAEQYHFAVRIDSDSGSPKLIFKKNASYRSTTHILDFGVHILDISSDHSLQGLLTKVTYTGRSNREGAEPTIEEVASTTLTALNDELGTTFLGDFSGYEAKIEDVTGHETEVSAVKARATAMLESAADSFVGGSLTCRFLPELTCASKITVKGAGWPLDGTFLVENVVHSLDGSGYRSKVRFTANSIASAGIPST